MKIVIYIDNYHASQTILMECLEPFVGSEPANCPICLEEVKPGKATSLQCKTCHGGMHKGCAKQWMKQKPSCPCCNTMFGKVKGNQPDGVMYFSVLKESLPGHDDSLTIQVTFHFPPGKQTRKHPNPGKKYPGTTRICYLPGTIEGLGMLQVMAEVFRGRAFFTIGTSVTTGKSGQIIWNGIHCKTRKTGGATCYAYPDPTYLDRVGAECSRKGYKVDKNIKWFSPNEEYVYLSCPDTSSLTWQRGLDFVIDPNVDQPLLCFVKKKPFNLGNRPWERLSKMLFAFGLNQLDNFDLRQIDKVIA
jgi:hypothetical protein